MQAREGFSISLENIHFLEEKLEQAITEQSGDNEKSSPDIHIEATLALEDVTLGNYKIIQQCAPFGVANPKPLFLFENIVIGSIKMFGKNKEHLELLFNKDSGGSVKAIHFYKSLSDFSGELTEGSVINLVAEIDYSTWGGRGDLRLRIVDISL
jgi:single-stranded-DNA-specific exonuclease